MLTPVHSWSYLEQIRPKKGIISIFGLITKISNLNKFARFIEKECRMLIITQLLYSVRCTFHDMYNFKLSDLPTGLYDSYGAGRYVVSAPGKGKELMIQDITQESRVDIVITVTKSYNAIFVSNQLLERLFEDARFLLLVAVERQATRFSIVLRQDGGAMQGMKIKYFEIGKLIEAMATNERLYLYLRHRMYMHSEETMRSVCVKLEAYRTTFHADFKTYTSVIRDIRIKTGAFFPIPGVLELPPVCNLIKMSELDLKKGCIKKFNASVRCTCILYREIAGKMLEHMDALAPLIYSNQPLQSIKEYHRCFLKTVIEPLSYDAKAKRKETKKLLAKFYKEYLNISKPDSAIKFCLCV